MHNILSLAKAKIISRNKLPRWLCEWVSFGGNEGYYGRISELEFYLDHFQTRRTEDGETVYISQPYNGLTYGNMKHLIEVCDKHGIGFSIRPDSDHYPGRTIAIQWYNNKPNKTNK